MTSRKIPGGKITDKLQEEASREAVNFYRAWRQKIKNGVLPIGIANVGKTTFLQRFEVADASLFLEFNRTLEINANTTKLRDDLAKHANGVEYYKSIDVPGDVPDQWAVAYHDNNPRVLVILVDHREPLDHIKQIRKFLGLINEGPSLWQKTKTVINFRWDNLSRIVFIENKADQLPEGRKNNIASKYKSLLADIQSTFKVPVQVFQASLNVPNPGQDKIFKSVIDGLSGK